MSNLSTSRWGRLAPILRVPCTASTCEYGEKLHGGHAGVAPIDWCKVCDGKGWLPPDPPEWWGVGDHPLKPQHIPWSRFLDAMWRTLKMYEYRGDDGE